MPIEFRWLLFVLGFAALVGAILRMIQQRQSSPRRRYEDPAENYADSE
jgi:hypothetical protein